MGIPEAKHPLIQDLIRLWEESPGYILPQNSFIKDKAKLEAMIDSLVEMQKQKVQLPPTALLNKPAVGVISTAPISAKTNHKSLEDTQWEKSLSSALAMTRVNPTQNTDSKLPPVPAFPDITKIPGAAEKLAELKVLDSITIPETKKEIAKPINIHILILYGLSLSAFILSIIAFKSRFF